MLFIAITNDAKPLQRKKREVNTFEEVLLFKIKLSLIFMRVLYLFILES